MDNCLEILSKCTGHCLNSMAALEVLNTRSEPKEPPWRPFVLAQSFPYKTDHAGLTGELVIGFTEERSALESAKALAGKMGAPVPDAFDETARDILREYISVSVGRAQRGLELDHSPILFGDARPHPGGEVKTRGRKSVDGYSIVLSLAFSEIRLQAIFSIKPAEAITGRKVLVVDDSSVVRAVISKILREMEMETAEAKNGLEGVEAFRSFQPDLTLMDLIMPELNGLEAIARIKEFAPEASFIILTSSSRRDQILTAKKLGVTTYLLKPPQAPVLIDRVCHALARSVP